MTLLIAAAGCFVLLHLLVAGTRLRGVLTGAIGEGPYMGLFSLASVGLLIWMVFAFGGARIDAANTLYWSVTPATRHVQVAFQLVAMIFVVVGLTTPNPTSVGQSATLERPDVARGMLRITRHPFLWGVAIWAGGHLLVNGNVAAFILFGSMLLLALLGTTSIDAKRRRSLGPTWDAFAARTSNIPFAAILAGRQSVKLGEIGWVRVVGAVAVWAGLIAVHGYAFGVSAIP